MDNFEKNVKSAMILIVSANFIMAIGMVIFGYAVESAIPFYAAIVIFIAGIALIFVMKNAMAKYKKKVEELNSNDQNNTK